MRIKRLLAAAVGVAMAFVAAEASPAFIQHRQDAFKAVPTSTEQIVFLGNSITNFHCWADAFVRPEGKGLDEALISNRGISDERAYHWKHTVQMMLDGEQKPAKMFIGIGTNDLNVGLPPEAVVNDIRAIIRQVQISSPQTEITLQSILPRRGDINNAVMRTLPLLESMASEMGVGFVDLSETMAQVPNNTDWAYDGLHPSGMGYRAWCRRISPLVGLDCAYTDAVYSTGGFGAVAGVRASQYGMMPVEEDDILIIGDPWVDAVQWHEFFGNHNVKNRSICNGNLSVDNVKTLIDRTLKANDSQKCPRAIVLCWGAIRTGNNLNASTVKSDYESLIAYVQAAAPQAKIIICQTPAINSDNHTANIEISKITSAPVVDLEANGMTAATASTWNMAGGLGSKGVLKAAQAVGKVLNEELGAGTAKIVTDEQFETYYANRNRRIEVAKYYNALYQHRLAASSDISAALTQIEDILKGNTVTDAQVAEAKQVRDNALAGRQFSPDPEKWYHISAPRNYEGGNASVGTLGHSDSKPYFFDNKLTAATTSGSDIWTFSQRPDGSYDIKSFDGYYLVPASTPKISLTAPSKGWTIEGGYAEAGTYVIRCGNIRLHRDNSNNAINYWHADDIGSHFYLTEFSGKLPLADGWYTFDIHSMEGSNASAQTWTQAAQTAGMTSLINTDGVYQQNASNFYMMGFDLPQQSREARYFFYLTSAGNGIYNMRTLHGYYVKDAATASYTPVDLPFPPHASADGVYRTSFMVWDHNLDANIKYLAGKFSNNYTYYTLSPASTDDFDVYSVKMIEGYRGEKMTGDAFVTLESEHNRGIPTVRDGGTFFVDRGVELAPEMLIASSEGTEPRISVAPGLITVDYSADTEDSIGEVSASASRREAFDLMGRSVTHPEGGIFIVNGKKLKL